LPLFTLILGGAASGKSSFAEALVRRQKGSNVYVATAQIYDDEMRDKVNAHIAARGPDWQTIEAPFNTADQLAKMTADKTVLVDCATMWLSNMMLNDLDLETETNALFAALEDRACDMTVVTNEVGKGIVPDNALGRKFREAQGRLNIKLAEEAERVILVTAGLPLALKGEQPK